MAARRELLEETGMHSVTFLAQVSPAPSLPCSHGASAGSAAIGHSTAQAAQAWLLCSGRLLFLPTSLLGPAEPSTARTMRLAQHCLLVHCGLVAQVLRYTVGKGRCPASSLVLQRWFSTFARCMLVSCLHADRSVAGLRVPNDSEGHPALDQISRPDTEVVRLILLS